MNKLRIRTNLKARSQILSNVKGAKQSSNHHEIDFSHTLLYTVFLKMQLISLLYLFSIVYGAPKFDQESLKELHDIERKKQPKPKPTLQQLQSEESKLLRILKSSEEKYGRLSAEYLTTLEKRGENLYLQQRFEDSFEISVEIVSLSESVHGRDHKLTGIALANLGAVSHRLGKLRECENAMYRALRIYIHNFRDNSKEVIRHRANMARFKVPADYSFQGISYEDFHGQIEL